MRHKHYTSYEKVFKILLLCGQSLKNKWLTVCFPLSRIFFKKPIAVTVRVCMAQNLSLCALDCYQK